MQARYRGRNDYDVLERPCLLKCIRYFFRAPIFFALLYGLLYTFAPEVSELGGLLTGKRDAVHSAAIWPCWEKYFFFPGGSNHHCPCQTT